MFAFARSKLGDVDILVNNAGAVRTYCNHVMDCFRTELICPSIFAQASSTSPMWKTSRTTSGTSC
jgi:hypothetical protein